MPVELWTSEAFVAEAAAWAAAAAAARGMTMTGEREQSHAQPWSSTIRFETDGGRLWFKVNGPGTRHEPALLRVLADLVPDLTPELLAADSDRGWSLMRDAGPVMRSVVPPESSWDLWAGVLRQYAEAQLALADHTDALLTTGVEDLRPVRLADRFAEVVEALAAAPADTGGLSAEDAGRLREALPAYGAWCAELAGSGVPPSVNHDDLHSANVCLNGSVAGIIDWGDAVVSHPFATMLSTLNSIAWHAGTGVDDPRVQAVRDAYLAPFAAYGTYAARGRWVALARVTGCASRALSYVHALEGEPPEAHARWDWPVRGWLLETLELAATLDR